MSAGTAATAAAVALTVGCVARHGEAAMQKVEPEPEPEPMNEQHPTTTLLPQEQALRASVGAIALARARGNHGEADYMTVEMLRRHALCKVTERPKPPEGALPPGLEVHQQELQLDIFRRRRRTRRRRSRRRWRASLHR